MIKVTSADGPFADCVLGQNFVIGAVANTEYLSPEQHGGIYGTVYRQYFNATLPSSLTSGNTVSMIIDYSLRYVEGANRGVARGWSSDGSNNALLRLSGTSGKAIYL